MILEICVESMESAIAAASGGADRIELCSALSEGGVTPSIGLIRAVRAAVSIGVFVIIRPRGGDFVYTDSEVEIMREDIRAVKALGVNGVTLGLLTAEGAVDVARTRALIELARPLEVTFHRAFDVSSDLERALEDVIACGADRILTSGGEPDAQRGSGRIAGLCAAAGGRIRIMAGGGIRESNVRNLALHTGAGEMHASLSKKIPSAPRHGNPRLHLGSQTDEFTRLTLREEDVRHFMATLKAIPRTARQKVSVQ